MEQQTFDTVWDALEASPAAARSLDMRARLAIAIGERVKGWDLSRAEAAKRLGISQALLEDLLSGRINDISLDALIDLAALAGLSVHLDIADAA